MQPASALASAQALLQNFAERHRLKLTEVIRREEIAVRATSIANIVINDAYANLDDAALADPAIGLLLNMLHRNVEHAEAAIVAFVSGCGASAEVVARAAVESSVNLLYIFAGEGLQRLKAYFEHYLSDVDRQVKNWEAEIGKLPMAEATIHREGIKRRRAANEALRRHIRALIGDPQERWPAKMEARFENIGEALSYRTFYARMSSEIHADAEETLRYLVGRLQNDETLLEKMALETVWTTRFYIHFAVLLFLKSSIAYAECYSLEPALHSLRRQLGEIETELIQISSHIGSGLT